MGRHKITGEPADPLERASDLAADCARLSLEAEGFELERIIILVETADPEARVGATSRNPNVDHATAGPEEIAAEAFEMAASLLGTATVILSDFGPEVCRRMVPVLLMLAEDLAKRSGGALKLVPVLGGQMPNPEDQ